MLKPETDEKVVVNFYFFLLSSTSILTADISCNILHLYSATSVFIPVRFVLCCKCFWKEIFMK